jgi:hypothetical protein
MCGFNVNPHILHVWLERADLPTLGVWFTCTTTHIVYTCVIRSLALMTGLGLLGMTESVP